MIIPENLEKRLRKAGYFFVGPSKHSAVKICHWTKKAILDENWCYKHEFYGINSHRCLQLSLTMPFCTNRCVYCWRNNEFNLPSWKGPVDAPAEILDDAIEAQRKLLNGFPGNPKVDMRKWNEAQNPIHCAISLSGEGTLYPKLAEFILELRKRQMTSFLVSNGEVPERFVELREKDALPTQLYISLSAYNEESQKRIQLPMISDAWSKFLRSLDLLKELDSLTRTVVRMTVAKGLNDGHIKEYSALIERAFPQYLEVKAYEAVGYSRERLGLDYVPSWEEIKEYAKEIAEATKYKYCIEWPPSRVVLLCRDSKAEEERIIKF